MSEQNNTVEREALERERDELRESLKYWMKKGTLRGMELDELRKENKNLLNRLENG